MLELCRSDPQGSKDMYGPFKRSPKTAFRRQGAAPTTTIFPAGTRPMPGVLCPRAHFRPLFTAPMAGAGDPVLCVTGLPCRLHDDPALALSLDGDHGLTQPGGINPLQAGTYGQPGPTRADKVQFCNLSADYMF